MNSFGITDDIDNAYNMLMESTGSKLVYHYATMDHGKFDIGFIGTGEELAKYGMGIYFTSTLESAKHYQRNGKGDGVIYECKIFLDGQSNILDWDALVDSVDIVDIVTQYYGEERVEAIRDAAMDSMYESGTSYSDSRFEEYFDKALVSSHEPDIWCELTEAAPDFDWSELKSMTEFQFDLTVDTIGTLYSMLGEPMEAMKFLRDYGFDGITYVSGETGTDVRNYVVFDDSNIKILGKM
jgi:hypothetical protein